MFLIQIIGFIENHHIIDRITVEYKKPTGIGMGTLPGFLTSLGLNLASADQQEIYFLSIAEAAKDPFDTFQQAKFAEAKEEREFERERELQIIKKFR